MVEKYHHETLDLGFRALCLSPYFIKYCSKLAKPRPYKLTSVIDFPFGHSHPMSKVESIKKVADQGADGVDVVINYSAAINEDWATLKDEIEAVVHISRMKNLEVKLILESHNYNTHTLKQVIELCLDAKPDFLKTNTGTGNNLNTLAQVKMIQRFSGDRIPIKASGGIRTVEQAQELLDSGVAIIGTSSAASW